MPLDTRWYMHGKDCECPECQRQRACNHQAIEEAYKGKPDVCPYCGYHTRFYNKDKKEYICRRIECHSNSLSKFLTNHFLHSHEE